MTQRSSMRSPYMEYAKLEAGAPFNIGGSGVMPLPLADLGIHLEDLEINNPAPGGYGYAPLLRRIAARFEVPPESVFTANGCSMANHLAMAAAFDPGDDVLIEEPTYKLLGETAAFLGGNVRRFLRREQDKFRLDLDEIGRRLTPRTRLIVLCNLHNPTSALVSESDLRALGALARDAGARVLVDEVYLEAVVPRPPTALHYGDEFMVTSSLTKAFGLGGLRCGWILAAADLIRRVAHLNDFFGVHQPYVAERLGELVFAQLDGVAARAQKLLTANRELAFDFLRSRNDLDCLLAEQGTTLAPQLKRGSVDQLCALLGKKFETGVVPGCYFEMPQHFRIGLGGATEVLREGLQRLGTALDEFTASAA